MKLKAYRSVLCKYVEATGVASGVKQLVHYKERGTDEGAAGDAAVKRRTDVVLQSHRALADTSFGANIGQPTPPGLQFYSGNFLDGTIKARWRKPYGFRQGFCLEPGLFPDSPNQPAFHRAGYPSGVLRPGEKYAMEMVYRFGVA